MSRRRFQRTLFGYEPESVQRTVEELETARKSLRLELDRQRAENEDLRRSSEFQPRAGGGSGAAGATTPAAHIPGRLFGGYRKAAVNAVLAEMGTALDIYRGERDTARAEVARLSASVESMRSDIEFWRSRQDNVDQQIEQAMERAREIETRAARKEGEVIRRAESRAGELISSAQKDARETLRMAETEAQAIVARFEPEVMAHSNRVGELLSLQRAITGRIHGVMREFDQQLMELSTPIVLSEPNIALSMPASEWQRQASAAANVERSSTPPAAVTAPPQPPVQQQQHVQHEAIAAPATTPLASAMAVSGPTSGPSTVVPLPDAAAAGATTPEVQAAAEPPAAENDPFVGALPMADDVMVPTQIVLRVFPLGRFARLMKLAREIATIDAVLPDQKGVIVRSHNHLSGELEVNFSESIPFVAQLKAISKFDLECATADGGQHIAIRVLGESPQ